MKERADKLMSLIEDCFLVRRLIHPKAKTSKQDKQLAFDTVVKIQHWLEEEQLSEVVMSD